ncbi:MAG: hypothetical protein ABW185_09115, partial [Sedimenticola sp.]
IETGDDVAGDDSEQQQEVDIGADPGLLDAVVRQGNATVQSGDIDDFYSDTVMVDSEEDLLFEELDEFYSHHRATGDKISDKLAGVTNKALRLLVPVDKEEREKRQKLMEEIRTRHRRPENVENLQVPRVEAVMWRQLKHETKANDVLMQRAIGNYHEAIVPVVKMIDMVHRDEKAPANVLKPLLIDTFKLLGDMSTATNSIRRERIKKELLPKYKSLCSEDQPPSATLLFGENFKDEVKQLNEAKQVVLTQQGVRSQFSQNTQRQGFLGQRGGGPTSYNQSRGNLVRFASPRSGSNFGQPGVRSRTPNYPQRGRGRAQPQRK